MGRVAAWPTIEAHAKEHDERALDPRKCMFHNLKAFKAAREQIDEIAREHIKGDVKKIPWVGKNLGDECRQCGLDGEPAASLDAPRGRRAGEGAVRGDHDGLP